VWSKLFDKLVEFVELFQCWTYVPEFERGVILRVGKFHRYLEPGFQWLMPLALEQDIHVNVKPEPVYLDVQSLETADGYSCNIQVGLIWRIVNPRLFLIENEDAESIITMLASGIVTDLVHELKWAEVKKPKFLSSLKRRLNHKARKRGAEIDEAITQDFCNGSASRLWHEGISLDFGDE